MNNYTDIYDFVIAQEAGYSKPIILEDGWSWSFKEHIRRSFLYKNSQFEEKNDDRNLRPFKNIVRPILNIQYRTEGFDVKDIEIYVDNSESYFKSFLVKKFHDRWSLKNQIDTFIDEVVESYVDYGGTLVKNIDESRPEVVDLKTLAFCDQTNILSGPFAIKHFFSPSELKEMKNWGDEKFGATMSIDGLIALSEPKKSSSEGVISTPGNYIEVYEVHGTLPGKWLGKEEDYLPQIQIIAFYKNDKDQKTGVTLFRAKESKLPFKFLPRDNIYGRALGFGGVEELFESQVWTNHSEIQIREMLELASKTFYKTTDSRFKTRNNLINSDNGQVFDLQEGKDISQIDTYPRNIQLFNNVLDRWEDHANRMGAAGDIFQGEQPTAGTPFASLQAQIIEGRSLHQWRQGKIAVFIEEIYREWVLPHISKEILKGQKFLSELSANELQEISNQIVQNLANKFVKERILNGQLVFPEEVETFKQNALDQFVSKGRNRFIEILKDEFKDEPLDIKANLVNKQKRLALFTDKLVSFVRQILARPDIKQDPDLVRMTNEILEYSGMSPISYGLKQSTGITQGGGRTEPLKELSARGLEAVEA